MTTVWIDATAGIAGDMLLGALVDAGAPIEGVQAAIDAVLPDAIRLESEQTVRGAMSARRIRVKQVAAQEVERTWPAIRDLISAADLDEQTRARALKTFEAIARVESKAHGLPLEQVHFHEVGGLDAIADVVGNCEAVRLLGANSISASWIALGNGRVNAAHGSMPVPVPAVSALALGWPVRALPAEVDEEVLAHLRAHQLGIPHDHDHGHVHLHPHEHPRDGEHEHPHDDEPGHGDAHGYPHEEEPALTSDPRDVGELATPTGVALLRTLASHPSDLPAGVPQAIGIGAGGKDIPGWANVVRVVVVDESQDASHASPEAAPHDASQSAPQPAPQGASHTVSQSGAAAPVEAHTATDASGRDVPPTVVDQIEANIDDLDHRLVPGIIAALLDAGARDAWATPIIMKKGRPALTISALVDGAHRAAVVDLLLTRTTTLGVRSWTVGREVLGREWRHVDVELPSGTHKLDVKIGQRDGVIVHAQAEWSAVAELADEAGISELDALQRANAAIVAAGLVAGNPLPQADND